MEPINGVVVVDKPVGPTSFAVVRQARLATGARKVGHGGTLDPLASGVLPICFGEATKLAQFLLDADKEYEAVVTFGAETDTYDAGGVVTARYPTDGVSAGRVTDALAAFRGVQSQVPPMYSALKRDGRPLYDYARAGETVDREPRTVQLHQVELQAFWRGTPPAVAQGPHAEPQPDGAAGPSHETVPSARIFIRCSKGTYVRSLAYDLGRALGTGAHLSALRRLRSGPFGLEDAVAPEDLSRKPLPVITPADALRHLPTLWATEDVARDLNHGKVVTWARATTDHRGAVPDVAAALVRILAPNGDLLAVAPGGNPDDPIRTMRVFRPLTLGDQSIAAGA
ncbi:MAG: tRNA pseudouridine(55) synthase TruB [Myxococcales bacterium]